MGPGMTGRRMGRRGEVAKKAAKKAVKKAAKKPRRSREEAANQAGRLTSVLKHKLYQKSSGGVRFFVYFFVRFSVSNAHDLALHRDARCLAREAAANIMGSAEPVPKGGRCVLRLSPMSGGEAQVRGRSPLSQYFPPISTLSRAPLPP
jgi:hypothetical protein